MPYKDSERQKKYFHNYDRRRNKTPKRRRQVSSAMKRFRKKHPGAFSYYKSSYGITFEDKVQMFRKQKGLCAACGEPLNPIIRRNHVDHDHVTKIVRGIVHWYCNLAIAYEEKHPGVLIKVIKFLQRWKKICKLS